MVVLVIAYQRFVKTTPKPSATKNSSGELVGPLDEFDVLDMVGGIEDGVGDAADTCGIFVVVGEEPKFRCRRT